MEILKGTERGTRETMSYLLPGVCQSRLVRQAGSHRLRSSQQRKRRDQRADWKEDGVQHQLPLTSLTRIQQSVSLTRLVAKLEHAVSSQHLALHHLLLAARVVRPASTHTYTQTDRRTNRTPITRSKSHIERVSLSFPSLACLQMLALPPSGRSDEMRPQSLISVLCPCDTSTSGPRPESQSLISISCRPLFEYPVGIRGDVVVVGRCSGMRRKSGTKAGLCVRD